MQHLIVWPTERWSPTPRVAVAVQLVGCMVAKVEVPVAAADTHICQLCGFAALILHPAYVCWDCLVSQQRLSCALPMLYSACCRHVADSQSLSLRWLHLHVRPTSLREGVVLRHQLIYLPKGPKALVGAIHMCICRMICIMVAP